jgi:hypothetical protein
MVRLADTSVINNISKFHIRLILQSLIVQSPKLAARHMSIVSECGKVYQILYRRLHQVSIGEFRARKHPFSLTNLNLLV